MNASQPLGQVLSVCVAFGLLTACNASLQTPPPAESTRSWMSPAAKSSDLLYVTDEGNYHVYVYDYPSGTLVGTLDTAYGSPTGLCVDKKGNIFITEYNGQEVLEYKHGGTNPIASLYDPGQPIGCAIDPTTGNLAVANEMSPSGGYGNIAIYANAKGEPKTYQDTSALELPYWCAYDNAGNLFIDGDYIKSGFKFVFVEMPKGSSGTFRTLSLAYPPGSPGGVQWDGKYITLGSATSQNGLIFQLTVSGSTVTVVNTTMLDGFNRMPTYWVLNSGNTKGRLGNPVIATSGADIGVFHYPKGGSATKTFTQNYPWSAVVSKAKH